MQSKHIVQIQVFLNQNFFLNKPRPAKPTKNNQPP